MFLTEWNTPSHCTTVNYSYCVCVTWSRTFLSKWWNDLSFGREFLELKPFDYGRRMDYLLVCNCSVFKLRSQFYTREKRERERNRATMSDKTEFGGTRRIAKKRQCEFLLQSPCHKIFKQTLNKHQMNGNDYAKWWVQANQMRTHTFSAVCYSFFRSCSCSCCCCYVLLFSLWVITINITNSTNADISFILSSSILCVFFPHSLYLHKIIARGLL